MCICWLLVLYRKATVTDIYKLMCMGVAFGAILLMIPIAGGYGDYYRKDQVEMSTFQIFDYSYTGDLKLFVSGLRVNDILHNELSIIRLNTWSTNITREQYPLGMILVACYHGVGNVDEVYLDCGDPMSFKNYRVFWYSLLSLIGYLVFLTVEAIGVKVFECINERYNIPGVDVDASFRFVNSNNDNDELRSDYLSTLETATTV
jgi:hypothetical protein